MKKILNTTTTALTALIALAASATQVSAGGDNFASGTIGITGEVPVYCKADLSEIGGNIELGNELGWEAFSKRYNFGVQCNTQSDITVTISGQNSCSDEHVFGGVGNIQRNFCLQGNSSADAKLPYSVKAWGRNAAGANCQSDFHNIVNGVGFHLSKNCITKEGTGAWSNYKTNVILDINIDPATDPLHLPAGIYSDTLSVLVNWS